jgi:hypothetical protein
MSTRTQLCEPARAALDIAVLCLALALPSAIAGGLDVRTLQGVNIWVKPLKFHLSFGLHWLTIACLLQALGRRMPPVESLGWCLRIGGVATVVEVLYITLQAARGRASHFNFSTPLEAVLYYALMGGAAVLIMGATMWVGWLLWQHAEPTQRRSGLWQGAVLGLILGSIVTLVVTAPLASGAIDGPGHWVGGARTDVAGLAIVGWSTTGGDLRVPHFFGTHLLQFLPLVGWLADRCGSSAPRRWVGWALALGLMLVVVTGVQALLGQPFLPR